MPRKRKINTGDISREIVGTGSVLSTHHEGVSKRPTEGIANNYLDNITANDMGRSSHAESPMNNPNFGRTDEGRR
jgi:hypothetical protein